MELYNLLLLNYQIKVRSDGMNLVLAFKVYCPILVKIELCELSKYLTSTNLFLGSHFKMKS